MITTEELFQEIKDFAEAVEKKLNPPDTYSVQVRNDTTGIIITVRTGIFEVETNKIIKMVEEEKLNEHSNNNG
jgi:hypothetical protein